MDFQDFSRTLNQISMTKHFVKSRRINEDTFNDTNE